MVHATAAERAQHSTFSQIVGEERAAQVTAAIIEALNDGVRSAMSVVSAHEDADAWVWGTARWRFCLHALHRAIRALPGARAPEPKTSWYADLGATLLYFYCFGKEPSGAQPEITLRPSELRHRLLNLGGIPGQLSLWKDDAEPARRPSMLCAFAADPTDGLLDLHIGEVHVDSVGRVTWLSHERVDLGPLAGERRMLPLSSDSQHFADHPEPTIEVRPRATPLS